MPAFETAVPTYYATVGHSKSWNLSILLGICGAGVLGMGMIVSATSPTEASVLYTATAGAQRTIAAVRQPVMPALRAEAPAMSAVATPEETAIAATSSPKDSFLWRLKVASPVLLMAVVLVEGVKRLLSPARPALAMAAQSGSRYTTALGAAEDDEIVDVIQKEKDEKARKIAELKAQEKFMRISTGKTQCPDCGYAYVAARGDPNYPVAAGTAFDDLPQDWACPTCGAPKTKFINDGVEVAGFAVNQGYGLGTNSMTGEQKSLLIYGLLLLGFMLFLAGYSLD